MLTRPSEQHKLTLKVSDSQKKRSPQNLGLCNNKIKQVNSFSSTNNNGFWPQAQPQTGKVQKLHVFEALRNTFPSEHPITEELCCSSARLAGREEGWPQCPQPQSLLDSLQINLLRQGKATRAERREFLADIPSYQSGGTTAPCAQPCLVCNYSIMKSVLQMCLQTPAYACFQFLNYDRPPNWVF